MAAELYFSAGPRWGVLALGVPLGFAFLFFGGGSDWLWLLQAVAMGPIFVEAFVRGKTLKRSMAWALAATLAFQFFLLWVRALQWGISPWAFLQQGIASAIHMALQFYGGMGMPQENGAQLALAARDLARAMVSILPGLFVSLNLLLYWWTLLVHRQLSSWRGVPGFGPESLNGWAIPYHWVWVTILGGILILLPGSLLGTIGLNLIMVMGTLHFLQGMAVLANFFRGRRVPPFLRGIFYALIFFHHAVFVGVMAIGLFDLWFDFRKRWGGSDRRQT